MKKLIIFILCAILLISILWIYLYKEPGKAAAYAKKGVINLSETDFGKNHVIDLNGEWEFYWNRLMEPDDFMKDSQGQPAYINVPGNWIHDQSGNTYMAEGYATYKLTIKDVPAKTYLGIRKQNIRSACKIFINGNLILQDGNPTNSEETVLLGNSPQIGYFETEGTTVELVIQAANYHYLVGGIGNSINSKVCLFITFLLSFSGLIHPPVVL